MTTACVALAFGCGRSASPPEVLFPEGVSAVDVRLVRRPSRATVPARPHTFVEPTRVSLVPLEVEPPLPAKLPKVADLDMLPPAPPEPLLVAATQDVASPEELLPKRATPPSPPEPSTPEPTQLVADVPAVEPAAAAPPAHTHPAPDGPRVTPDDAAPVPEQAGVDKGVEVVNLPTPRYPPSCRRRGEEGRVVLRIEVLSDGAAGEITVLEHVGSPAFVEAAVEAAREATFRPATRDGRPVASFIVQPFQFALR